MSGKAMGYRPTDEALRALIEHGLDIVMFADHDGTLLYVSPSVERILGFLPSDMVSHTCMSFTHSDEMVATRGKLARVLQNPGAKLLLECRWRNVSGEYRDMDITAQNLLDDDAVGAIVLTARDVTEQKATRQELLDQERNFRALAENTRDIIAFYQFHPEPRLQFISPSVEPILGYPRQLFYDDPHLHHRLVHEDDRALLAKLVEADPEQLRKPQTLRWVHADGSTVWIEQLIVPELDADGRVLATRAICRDVTEQVALESQLREGQKMEAVGRLAGGIAHDFNNLLAAAKLTLERVRRQDLASPALLTELHHVDEVIDRGAELIKQLLTFSRHHHDDQGSVDLAACLYKLEPMLRRLLPESIELALEVVGDRAWIDLASSPLEQVIVNLLVNGRDAMPNGGALTVRVESTADEVTLCVTDSGVGMTSTQQRRAFEPFYSTKGAGKGTGLGLAVVYGVVEQSGGTLELHTSPEKGTTLRLCWPRGARPADVIANSGGTPGPGRRESVLVVEDEPKLRELVAELLENAGYRVIVAADAEQAVTIGNDAALDIDLLLTDVIMPQRNGPEVALALRSTRPGLPVLYMSGYAADMLSSQGLGDQVLCKPFTAKQLAEAVRHTLDKATATATL